MPAGRPEWAAGWPNVHFVDDLAAAVEAREMLRATGM